MCRSVQLVAFSNIIQSSLRKWNFINESGWERFCSNNCWLNLSRRLNYHWCHCYGYWKWDDIEFTCSNDVDLWQRTQTFRWTNYSSLSDPSQFNKGSSLWITFFLVMIFSIFKFRDLNAKYFILWYYEYLIKSM